MRRVELFYVAKAGDRKEKIWEITSVHGEFLFRDRNELYRFEEKLEDAFRFAFGSDCEVDHILLASPSKNECKSFCVDNQGLCHNCGCKEEDH